MAHEQSPAESTPRSGSRWRGRRAWWLLLLLPASLVAAVPVMLTASIGQCGFGDCTGPQPLGLDQIILGGVGWVAAGGVAALPIVLVTWAQLRDRLVAAASYCLIVAAAGFTYLASGPSF